MVQKKHIRQRFKTRPIVLCTELVDLSEADYENVKEIHRLVTDEVESKFTEALSVAIKCYADTGVVPTVEEVSTQVGNLMRGGKD